MDDLRAAGLDAARKRVAPAPGRSSWPQQRLGAGDRRGARPPPPPPPRRWGGGGGAERSAGQGARVARRVGAGKAEEVGGGTSRGGGGAVAARVGPGAAGANAGAADVPAGGGGKAGNKKRAFASSSAPREGSGGGEVGSKKRWRVVSAERHFPPGCGRGGDRAGDGSRVVATAPARPGGGSSASPTKPPAAAAAAARHPPRTVSEAGSGGVLKKASAAVGGSRVVAAPTRRGGGRAALPTKPAAPPHRSVGKAGSVGVLKKVSAAIVPRPVADGGGRHGPHAAALKSLQPSRWSGVAAADGLLDTDSQGRSGRGGFGSGKEVVRFLPKPGVISAIHRFPPGRGRRVKVSQPLNKSAEKCPDTESKDSSTSSDSFGPKKKVTVKGPDHLRLKIASACTMGSISKVDDLVDSILADDAFLKAEAAYQRKLQGELNGSSDARSKFKMICGRFQFICKAIVQFVQQRSLKISRIDIAAGKVIKELPGFTEQGAVIGDVPGVEVGDEFLYRVHLALVGLHRLHRKGIDSTRDENNLPVAISIVASGRYPDELLSSGELIYTGSGGKYAGKKSNENQKLEGGNLALKNCIQTKTPVRVIHGFKGREEGSHSKAKGASAFTYDGLYHVVHCWKEGQAGSKVFKYKLLRIPGQPELPHRSKTASGRKTGIMC